MGLGVSIWLYFGFVHLTGNDFDYVVRMAMRQLEVEASRTPCASQHVILYWIMM